MSKLCTIDSIYYFFSINVSMIAKNGFSHNKVGKKKLVKVATFWLGD